MGRPVDSSPGRRQEHRDRPLPILAKAAAFCAVCTLILYPRLGLSGLRTVAALVVPLAATEFGVMKLLGRATPVAFLKNRRKATAVGSGLGLILAAVAGRVGALTVVFVAAAWGVVLLALAVMVWSRVRPVRA